MKKDRSLPLARMEREPEKPKSAPPIHWSEKFLLLLLSVHLSFLPWALGAMPLWSQKLSLGLAAAGFLAALLLNPPSTQVFPKTPAWKKLLRSWSFWLGSAILGYIAIQALNPAYTYLELGGKPWIVPVEHISWLPAGMETPLKQMSPFRHLMLFASLFLTLWTILLFLERPRSIRFLLGVLTLNGVALACLAFGQMFTGAEGIFWKIRAASGNSFYASFVYRNHAAPYLNLLLALSIGLYFYFRERTWKTNGRETDKTPIFFFTSTILFTAVLFSQSRGGILVASMLLLLAIIYTAIQSWRWGRLRETSVISSILLGLLILFTSVFTAVIGPERIVERFKLFAQEGGGTSVESRLQAAQATSEMFREKWLWGWGAGSFEYAFPKFQANYPDIYYREHRGKRTYHVWQYAHNDWLQYPAEYGVAGMSLFLAGLLGWLVSLRRHRGLRQPVAVWLALGVFLTLLHGIGEFVLQNPAILITAAAAIGLSLRSSVLETARMRRKSRGTD